MKKINFIKYIGFAIIALLASCQDDDLPGEGEVADVSGPAPFYSTVNNTVTERDGDGNVVNVDYEFQFLSGDFLAVNGTAYSWVITPSTGVNFLDLETRGTLEGLETQLEASMAALATAEAADPVDEEAIQTIQMNIVNGEAEIATIIEAQIAAGFLADNPTQRPIDDFVLNTQNIAIVFPDAGTYDVALTVTDDLGASATTGDDDEEGVNTNEIILLGPEGTIPDSIPNFEAVSIEGTNTVQFTSTSVGAEEFFWDFNGEGTSTDPNPEFTFAEQGLLTVTLTTRNSEGVPTTLLRQVGVGDGVASIGQFAFIADTTGDTGEIRLALADAGIPSPLTNGMLSVNVRKTASSADAFISVFGSSASNAGAIVDIRLGEGEGENFSLRNESDATTAPEFTPDQIYTVVVTWDENERITVSIDGEQITAAPIPSGGDERILDGAEIIAFRFGTNDNIQDSADEGFLVDNIRIYDNSGATPTLLYNEDFEGFPVGTDLTGGEGVGNVFASNTQEATIMAE